MPRPPAGKNQRSGPRYACRATARSAQPCSAAPNVLTGSFIAMFPRNRLTDNPPFAHAEVRRIVHTVVRLTTPQYGLRFASALLEAWPPACSGRRPRATSLPAQNRNTLFLQQGIPLLDQSFKLFGLLRDPVRVSSLIPGARICSRLLNELPDVVTNNGDMPLEFRQGKRTVVAHRVSPGQVLRNASRLGYE